MYKHSFLYRCASLFLFFGLSVSTFAAPGITGLVDIRPAFTPESDTAITDNAAELGYQFNDTFALSYLQMFQTGLMSRVADEGNFDFSIGDAFIRARLNKLWVSADETWSFSYQPRFYLPTSSASRDKGMVTKMRNYLIFTKKYSPTFSLSLMEIPIFHIDSESGYEGASGPVANIAFQNRVYAIASLQLTEKFSLSLPLMFHITKNRDHDAAATDNAGVTYTLWTYPELSYSVTDKTTLGVAYYSGNLVDSDLGGFNIGDGLGSGTIEFSFSYSI